jgi:outer membrane protein assembly factor BamE (lipoprotein component of BamABCDE complex)
MKSYWLIPLGICIAGCMASNGLQYEAMSETNQYHMAKLRKGMSEKQVLQIMHKPYSYESFQVEDDIYDVWFYVTRPSGLAQTRMVAQNLTPLTFKNGTLVGTGYNWYYYAMKEEAAQVAAQKPETETPKTQEAEDKDFEKTLRANPNPPSTSLSDPNPIQKNTPQNPKLPPNVQTIGEGEVSYGPNVQKDYGPTRFLSLVKGMSETQVFQMIGEPMKYESFEMNHDLYDVWFYETIKSKSNKPSLIPQNLTPIIFKNSMFISMSDDELYRLKDQASRIQSAQKLASDQVEEKSSAEITTEQSPRKKYSIFKPYVPKTPLSVSQKSFSKMRRGMTEKKVMDLLGSTAEQEVITIGDDVYDVWFYEITPKNAKNPSKKIPLTFKNGKLVGLSVVEYEKIKKQADENERLKSRQDVDRGEEEESEQNFNYW